MTQSAKKIITCLAIFCLCQGIISDLCAQYPKVRTDVFFNTFQKEDGLPNATLNCFAEDRDGFIWIGTLNGLSKFNGTTFVNYFEGTDSTSLYQDEINELIAIDNQLWIGSANGLSMMDIGTEEFYHFPLSDENQYSNTIEAMMVIDDDLWIGYESNGDLSGALAVFSLATKSFESVRSDEGVYDNVHAIYKDPINDNRVWVGSGDLYSVDTELSMTVPHTRHITFRPKRRGVTDIVHLFGDEYLVSTTRGLYAYNLTLNEWSPKMTYNKGESLSVFSLNYIKSMTRLSQLEIILNTYDLGLIIYNTKEETFSRFDINDDHPFGVPSSRSHRSFIDSKGRIWNGFYTGMSVVVADAQIVQLNEISPKGETSLPLPLSDGMEVMIDDSHYLFRQGAQNGRRLNSLFKKNWLYAAKDYGDNTYYLFSEALYCKDARGRYRKVVDKSIFKKGEEQRRWFKFFSIDKSNTIWITTEMGNVVKYNEEEGGVFLEIKDEKIGICGGTQEASYRVAHGDNETIISHACGLLIYDKQSNLLVDINDYLRDSIWAKEIWTYGIEYLENGRYIVGTFREGIYELDIPNKKVRLLSEDLKNIIVSNITIDDDKRVWCATDAGIVLYDMTTSYFAFIDEKHGLPEEYLIFQRPFFAFDGSLKIASNGYINQLNTKNIIPEKNQSHPVITKVSNGNLLVTPNAYVSKDSLYTFSHNRNNIEIEFDHTMSFDPSDHKFYYKMTGLNDEWVNAGKARSVRFFGLNPGRYNLLVTNDPQGAQLTQLGIIIKQPFWATWWFRLLSLLTVLGLMYLIYKNQIEKIRTKLRLEEEARQNENLKSRNDIIEEQNNELTRLNQSKDKFFSVLAHDLRSPLAAFSGLGKQLNYHIDRKNLKKVTMLSGHIQESAERLTTLVDNLLNWSLIQTNRISKEPEAMSLGTVAVEMISQLTDMLSAKQLNVNSDIPPQAIILADVQGVHIVLRNVLTNAIKFSNVGSTIHLKAALGNDVQLKVIDEGVGMSAEQIDSFNKKQLSTTIGTAGEQGIGLGLELCKELMEMNNGKIEISSKEEKGTMVTLYFKKHIDG